VLLSGVDRDRELLDRWRAGDAGAGQALFERHFDAIYRFFDSKCSGEIDDLVQRTFLACLKARDRFRGDATFRTFLFSVARYELYSYFRVQRREGARFDPLISSVAEIVTTPRSRMARDEAHRRVLEAMAQLPVETQMLLELHYREDLSIAELAEVFEAPAVTIRTRLHRGRRALRDLLGVNEGSPELEVDVLKKPAPDGDEDV
jgi:RNA polymerase sigma factor (sigma-70 family)